MKTCKEKAIEWGVSERTVNNFCKNKRILGAVKAGKGWQIPDDAEKPIDKRVKSGNYKKIVATIYNAYNINHDEIDESDATIVNNTRGYKCVLELPSSMSGNMKDAINYAIDNSNFVLPKNIGRCKTIGASFVDGIFDKYEVLDYFNVEDFDKEDYNPFKNIIVLGVNI